MAKVARKIDYIAQSQHGNPVASFDREIAARQFVDDRAKRGVTLRLVKVTTRTEEI